MDEEELSAFEKAGERLCERLDEMTIRRREQHEAWKAAGNSRNELIRNGATEILTVDGVECWIARSPLWDEAEKVNGYADIPIREETRRFLLDSCGYCGYACFKEKPVIEPEAEGILAYVPVHGGISYWEHDRVGSAYGFDTQHSNSRDYPIRDLDWMKNQLVLLVLGIKQAAKIEPEYLAADGDNERRGKLVQPLLDLADDLNMGVLLNIMRGEL